MGHPAARVTQHLVVSPKAHHGSSGACQSTVGAALGRVLVWCMCDVANLYCVSASVSVLVVVERANGAQCALKSALLVGQ